MDQNYIVLIQNIVSPQIILNLAKPALYTYLLAIIIVDNPTPGRYNSSFSKRFALQPLTDNFTLATLPGAITARMYLESV